MSGSTGTRYYTPNPYEPDQNGVPLAGGQLFFYETGSSTPQATYQDAALTIANTNPVIADANGRFGSIFLLNSPAYLVQLWTAPTTDNPTGSEIWSEDPVGPGTGGVPTNTGGIVGEVRAFAGPAAQVPAGWYLCYGQAVSRSTYSAAFTVLGTTWGAGDGSTTFNLPDLRGRGLFGLDNMGGTAANRLTTGVSGVPGNALGGTGGNQATQAHVHTLTDPGHDHTLTDPGHQHQETVGQGTGGSVSDWNIGAVGTSTGVSLFTEPATTGIAATDNAMIGIAATDGYGAGGSQNMPPAAVVLWIVYLGV